MTFLEHAEYAWRAFVRHMITPYLKPARPGQPQATLIDEDGNMLVYEVTLPPPNAPDVVKRELSYTENGGEVNVLTGDGSATTMTVKVHDDAAVKLWLTDFDDAGNASDPSPPLEFVAKDTIPPPAPGELGVKLVGEE